MSEIPPDVANKARGIQEQFNARVTAIKTNGDITQEARLRQLARAFIDAEDELAQLKETYLGNTATRTVNLTRDVFGAASSVGGDAISVRDADDRVARLEDGRTALDLLSRAEANGDQVLARAIAQRAFNEREGFFGAEEWDPVLQAYLVPRPDVAAKMAELAAAQRSSMQRHFMDEALFVVFKPTELGNLNPTLVAAARPR